jgi:protein gp37
MARRTAIAWTEATWNPVTGCDQASPGCESCYAMRLAARLKAMGSRRYQNDGAPPTSGPGFGVTTHPDLLRQPMSWRSPSMVFVCSMADLFHPRVPDDFIAQVFAVMAASPRHTYQVLTKRHARLRALLSRPAFAAQVLTQARSLPSRGHDVAAQDWPLPNVWVGVSVEDQLRAGQRTPALAKTPAVVRFLSCEPLLEQVDITAWLADLDWVIAGGESGPQHRPLVAQWVRSLRDQCAHGQVPFFFKQWGGRTPTAGGHLLDGRIHHGMPGYQRTHRLLVDGKVGPGPRPASA